MSAKRIEISINRHFTNKATSSNAAYAVGWKNANLTVEELAIEINQGHAFAPCFKNERRLGRNFEKAGFLAIDVDGTMPLDDARRHPFVLLYGTLMYTTASHGRFGRDHFRIIFATANPIKDARTWSAAQQKLAALFGSDSAVCDSARMFFGSKGSDPITLGNMLSAEALERLLESGSDGSGESDEFRIGGHSVGPTVHYSLRIKDASGRWFILDELPNAARVHCPFHDDQRPSAFIVTSEKGVKGIYCKACRSTSWPEKALSTSYDFDWFSGYVRSKLTPPAMKPKGAAADPEVVTVEDDLPDVQWMDRKYLPPFTAQSGVTLVKSPKGSGKTEQLIEIVNFAKAQRLSVLMLGHRRILLAEQAERLGLDNYQDDDPQGEPNRSKKRKKISDYYAVCLDSLPGRLKCRRQYDIVIVDEAEQVVSHVMAESVRRPAQVHSALQYYVTTAHSLFALDADLGQVATKFIERCRPDLWNHETRVIVNTHLESGKAFDLFHSDVNLTCDLLEQLRQGKRIFVACNSKRYARKLDRLIENEFGNTKTRMLVTADEKTTSKVQNFLKNIRDEILKFDVTIASPAIGTGIDITFEGGAAKIDGVYGFFQQGINSHYDADQQIGRVRNPKFVKVWVSGTPLAFETDANAIMADLVATGEAGEAILGYHRDGVPKVAEAHPMLRLKTDVYCAQRASQNRLRDNFIAHKRRNGWVAQHISKPSGDYGKVDNALSHAGRQLYDEDVNNVVCAPSITPAEYASLSLRKNAGETLPATDSFKITRFEIERFYFQPATADLVMSDDGGRYRMAVETYEKLFDRFFNWESQLYLFNRYRNGTSLADSMGADRFGLLSAIFLASGLIREGKLNGDRLFSKNDLSEFVRFCEGRDLIIQREMHLLLRKDLVRDPVQSLNIFLEMVGQAVEKVETRKVAGQKQYFYRLNAAAISKIEVIAARRKSARQGEFEANDNGALNHAALDVVEIALRRERKKRAASRAERGQARKQKNDLTRFF